MPNHNGKNLIKYRYYFFEKNKISGKNLNLPQFSTKPSCRNSAKNRTVDPQRQRRVGTCSYRCCCRSRTPSGPRLRSQGHILRRQRSRLALRRRQKRFQLLELLRRHIVISRNTNV
jgi:hypothetical protein